MTLPLLHNKHGLRQYSKTSFPDQLVAFSVANAVGTYELGDIVAFTDIITDINPGFPGWDGNTNTFVCPYNGLYFFTASIFREYTEDNVLICLKTSSDTSNIVCILNHVMSNDVGDYLSYSSTLSAIVQCQVGEYVWLEVVAYGGIIMDYSSYHYNHFSGLLLRGGIA